MQVYSIHFQIEKCLSMNKLLIFAAHTTYPGNNMYQKCKGKSGLWVLHELINKIYAENMKIIVGAV